MGEKKGTDRSVPFVPRRVDYQPMVQVTVFGLFE